MGDDGIMSVKGRQSGQRRGRGVLRSHESRVRVSRALGGACVRGGHRPRRRGGGDDLLDLTETWSTIRHRL